MLTGKCISYGGSEIRPEATGYGLVYFVREMLATRGLSLEVRPSSAALWPPGPVPGARATERRAGRAGARGRDLWVRQRGALRVREGDRSPPPHRHTVLTGRVSSRRPC